MKSYEMQSILSTYSDGHGFLIRDYQGKATVTVSHMSHCLNSKYPPESPLIIVNPYITPYIAPL